MLDKYPEFAAVFVEGIPDLFRDVLSATADGVVIANTDGSIIWVNPAFEKLTGYTISEVLNENPKILKSGKQAPAFYKELWDTISSGKVWHGELWNRKKDGTIYLEEQSITPVLDESGDIKYYIAIKRDVTQQNQLQEQLNQAKRIEAIGQLTAGVAHNFNNKLASILGFAELAVEEAKQYSNEEIDDCLNEILVASRSARDLVKQMMAFSLNEFSDLKLGSVDLIVKETIKLISSTAPASIKILLDLKEVPQSTFDPVRLHQILIGLSMNAVQAMSGHGELTLSTDVIRIDDIKCDSCHEIIEGDYISISLRDTGKGILPENLEKIFMPFFTTHQNEGGTGMGLSAIHGLLHEMNGHVIVESIIEQYTVFTLLLPLDNVNDETITGDSEIKNTDEKEKHIMVVDDEQAIADFLSEILELNGYQVSIETNSKEAFKIISRHPEKYDLLITDQSMPQLKGTELAELVYEVRQDLPVILMTGYKNDKETKGLDFISEVLNKPFETKDLLYKIKHL